MKFNKLTAVCAFALLVSCQTKAQKKETFEVEKTAQEWKLQLTDLQYRVLRTAGTERAFSSPLNKIYQNGIWQKIPLSFVYHSNILSL